MSLGFAALRRLEPETAHAAALRMLRYGPSLPLAEPSERGRLTIEALGTTFSSPIGLAAGFDKDAVALGPLMRLGFGAIEVGTVTIHPQQGNARPRVFRLPEDEAVINRLGFNSKGLDQFVRRLARAPRASPFGANIGLNRTGASPLRDFARLAAAVSPYVDWITINVSSPNTPGLRDLQAPAHLRGILVHTRAAMPDQQPLVVKLSPDLASEDVAPIVEAAIEGGATALIVSNTTIARPAGLRSRHAAEAGGLSGRPLFIPSTDLLARTSRLAKGRLVVIGAGGVFKGEHVLAKMLAGASLVQVYTGFIFHGPTFLARLHRELITALDNSGFDTAASAVGAGLRGEFPTRPSPGMREGYLPDELEFPPADPPAPPGPEV